MVLRKHELEGKLGEERRMINKGVLRDDNPLDQSPEFEALLVACRRGDLRKCQELITLGVNINGKDSFDYTPLIVASLCGHYELVRLLLESGALAERNTFQGERCIYNALNDRIRNLLLQYDFSKTSDPYLYWSTHLSGLLARTAPATSDLCLVAGNVRFNLHRFILAARTGLGARPDAAACAALAAVPVEALHIALRHVYLGDLPPDLVPPGSPPEHEERVARGLDRVSSQLAIPRLWEAFLAGSGDRRLARQRFRDEEERALKQIGDFFRAHVLGGKMLVDPERVPDVRCGHDNAAAADVLLCAHESPADDGAETPPGLNSQGIPIGADRRRPRAALYPAHKAMLIRSPYFERMFSGEYVESQASDHLRIVTVDCSPAVLELVLGFLYTESVACPLEHALDLLYAADMLFLDGLKSKAAVAISTLGSGPASGALVDRARLSAIDAAASAEPINIYDVIHAAWDLRVQRLEEFAARYLAGRLEDYIDDPEFHLLIRQSADRIRRREETDSIELLDDIRYYLSERFRLRFEDAGLEDMLAAEPEPSEKDEPAPPADKGGRAASPPAAEVGREPQHQQHQHRKIEERHIENGAARTLAGDLADDEFASDAINYQVLLGKIDAMLDRLKLDA